MEDVDVSKTISETGFQLQHGHLKQRGDWLAIEEHPPA
jgi:hypothetical protein